MKSRMRNAIAWLTTLGVFALSGAAMATNGYFTHGIGTESKGMAGTGIGSNGFNGPIVAASNPALAVFADDSWEVGLAIFSPRRAYNPGPSAAMGSGGAFTINPGNVTSDSNWFPIPYVAKNFRLANESVINVTFYGRGGMNTDWSESDASAWFDPTGMGGLGVEFDGTYGAGDAGVDLMQAFLMVDYAFKAGDNFAIGIGPVFAVQMFEAKGVRTFEPFTKTFNDCFFYQPPLSCDPSAESLTDNSHDTSTGWGFSGGFWWGITDHVSIGASYQSKLSMSEFDDYSDLFAQSGGFDIPSSAKFGISFLGSNDVRLNVDVEHTEYSEVDSVGNPMANLELCPYTIFAFTGDPVLAATIGMPEYCLGGSSGGGFGWEDMTTYKVGLEWTKDASTTWRFGYSYGEQPIQGADVMFNILAPGVMEQHLTLGLSKRRSNGGAWSFSFMYAPRKTVKGRSMFDPTQEIELKMNQFELEFSYLF